jgi:hypothetical protein
MNSLAFLQFELICAQARLAEYFEKLSQLSEADLTYSLQNGQPANPEVKGYGGYAIRWILTRRCLTATVD